MAKNAIGEQEIQCAIGRGRCSGASALAYANQYQQVVSLDWFTGRSRQAQHAGTDRGQPQAAFLARVLDCTDEMRGIVHVMRRINAGVRRRF